MISLDEVRRLDLRIAEITSARPIPGSAKLLAMTADLGGEQRTLVAGVAGSYRPEELVGLQVVIVANLETARIHGVESQGMLLGVGCADVTGISLLTPHRRVVNGASVA